MQIDAGGVSWSADLRTAGAAARALEDAGYAGVWSAETAHDPFFPLLLAAQATERLRVGTAIAVAFARSPMTVANQANDLQAFSGGRFTLGLGSQVRPHIERRFSMPWSQPAARMREFVSALRAIWACWNDGVPLRFEGDFYTHTLMTPYFTPEPNPHGPPRVVLGAVNARMAQVAGEVADGLYLHSFVTRDYLTEVLLPAVAQGGAREGFEVALPVFVVTGHDDAQREAADAATRKQIAFYASTPGYRAVLEQHGWEGLQPELQELSRAGEWDRMGTLVDDDMLATFAVQGAPGDIAGAVRERFDGLVQRLSFYLPYDAAPEVDAEILAGFADTGGPLA